MEQNQNTPFNANLFLDNLIHEMGMQNQPYEKVKELKEKMAKALSYSLHEAILSHVDPLVIDEVLEHQKNESDVVLLLQKIMEKSPHLEGVILSVFEKFKKNMLEAHNRFKK